jgi:hypothetical protein
MISRHHFFGNRSAHIIVVVARPCANFFEIHSFLPDEALTQSIYSTYLGRYIYTVNNFHNKINVIALSLTVLKNILCFQKPS